MEKQKFEEGDQTFGLLTRYFDCSQPQCHHLFRTVNAFDSFRTNLKHFMCIRVNNENHVVQQEIRYPHLFNPFL